MQINRTTTSPELSSTSIQKTIDNNHSKPDYATKSFPSSNTVVDTKVEFNIDMHNITPNEYDALTKAGITDLATPIIFPGGRIHLDGKQAELGDVKADYIGQINNSIEAANFRGDTSSVKFLQERLEVVKELHGQTVLLPSKPFKNIVA